MDRLKHTTRKANDFPCDLNKMKMRKCDCKHKIKKKQTNNSKTIVVNKYSTQKKTNVLSKNDFLRLFGKEKKLSLLKKLSQVGEFAARETVDIKGPKEKIFKIRIIGPFRENSQVEISKTDGYKLGIMPPIRISGDIEDTPGIKVIGPHGSIKLNKGLIVAKRHIHMSEQDAKYFKVHSGQIVSVKIMGERGLIYNNVIVRIDSSYRLSFQIDTDEANAADIEHSDQGILLR